MLPHDPDGPAADRQPGDSDVASMTSDGPAPTGLVDQPILTPVLRSPGERRRGWPLAVAMVLVAVMAGGALFLSGYTVGRDQGRTPGSSVTEQQAWQPFWDIYDAIRQRYPLGPVDRTTLGPATTPARGRARSSAAGSMRAAARRSAGCAG